MQDLTEQELRDSGFSEKQIAILKKNLERENLTIFFQLKDLRKRLMSMCGGFLLMSAIWVYFFISEGIQSFIEFSPVMVISCLCVYFMTPLPDGMKAYKFFKKMIIERSYYFLQASMRIEFNALTSL